jgi:CRISPR-associated protein Cas5h
MKIVAFDLWGNYGHFKVPYTTTSPLTLPFPSKTALYGIIGAFLGYGKNDYLKKFQNKSWKFAVTLNNPIVKTHIAENLIDSKKVKMFARMKTGTPCRTQIKIEFLKDPSFRIYAASTQTEELQKLEELLKNHNSTYSVYLGISECIANFEYIGSFETTDVLPDNIIEISSILPLSTISGLSEIDFSKNDRKYIKVHAPLEMAPDRELLASEDFIVEASGKTILAKPNQATKIEEANKFIVLF